MRPSRSLSILAAVMITFLSIVPLASAGEGTAGDYFRGMGIQIGRGLWNVVSSPAEIPCTMTSDIKAEGGVGAVTGFGKGLALFVRRVVVGVAEILTFVMPAEATIPQVCSGQESAPAAVS